LEVMTKQWWEGPQKTSVSQSGKEVVWDPRGTWRPQGGGNRMLIELQNQHLESFGFL